MSKNIMEKTQVKIQINGHEILAKKDDTILDAAKRSGIRIPTLCHHPMLSNSGACRMCVVEVEGCQRLVASCTHPVSEGLVVKTHSERVYNARKTILELIIANHPMVCLECERNQNCELQDLAEEYNITEVRYKGKRREAVLDTSSDSIVRDLDKCILCGRCVRACGDDVQKVWAIGTVNRGFESKIASAFDVPLDESVCVNCGQCTAVCPTGALREKSHIQKVMDAIFDPEKVTIVQTAPTIRVSLAEALGYEVGKISTGKMVRALKEVGIDKVFDTSLSADLTIMEEASEFLHRVQHNGKLPMFTSCSPGWVKFVETFYPEFIPNLSTCKSPQQMLGALIKSYYAQKANIDPKNIFSISIMPCTAKKSEGNRPEMSQEKISDVDAVLTTRELARLIKITGLDFGTLEDAEFDSPLAESTGAGNIFASSGGVMEAALRTAHYLITNKELEDIEFKFVRGLEGVKEGELEINGIKLKIAVVNSLGNARDLLDKLLCKELHYDFIEVMSCPGGCIGGGGQPRIKEQEKLLARMKAIYEIDKTKELRESHHNPEIKKLYDEFLEEPYGEKAHKYLHTRYRKRLGF